MRKKKNPATQNRWGRFPVAVLLEQTAQAKYLICLGKVAWRSLLESR